MQLEDLHRFEGLERKVGFEGLGNEGDTRSGERILDQTIIIGREEDRTDAASSQARHRLVQLHKGAGLANVSLQLQFEIGLAVLLNKSVDQRKARLVHSTELSAQELLELPKCRVASGSACPGPHPEHRMYTAFAIALEKIAKLLHLRCDRLSHGCFPPPGKMWVKLSTTKGWWRDG